MTIFTLAVKNLRHNLRSYAAYFLSSTFAVWLFYLYTSLIDHPDFVAKIGEDLRTVMYFLAFIVGGFALLFLLYSHSAFIKARQKELALLSLLGMKPGQIARTVIAENGLVGLVAIGAGGGLGVITSRLFFLGLGRVLELRRPVAFHFSPEALGLTVVMFACIFVVVSIYTRLRLIGLPVAELLRDARRPKAAPRFSPWLLALSVALIGGAYGLALAAAGELGELNANPEELFLPYLVLVLAGTYLLFTQGSVVALRWLQRRPGIYYRGTGLISLSQLVFKLRDNARLLFMVSLLSTVVLATLGIFYSGTLKVEAGALDQAPVAVQVLGEPGGVGPDRVAQILAEGGVAPTESVQTEVLPGAIALVSVGPVPEAGKALPGARMELPVMALSGFNAWQAAFGGQPLDLAALGAGAGPGVVVHHWPPTMTIPFAREGQPATVYAGGEELSLLRVPLDMRLNRSASVAVLTDEAFAALQDRTGAAMLYGYSLADWKGSRPALEQLQQEMGLAGDELGGPIGKTLSGTRLTYDSARQFYGFALFLAAFISLLFFLAAGNMLYFKLFTDLYEDRKQFQGLHKVGIRPLEIGRVVSVQTLALFGLPFAVALPNAAIFMLMAFSSSKLEVWRPLGTVTVLYLALYGVYYLAARRTFVSAMLEQ